MERSDHLAGLSSEHGSCSPRARLPKRWSEELVVIGRAAAVEVEHPGSEVELALAGSRIARHLVEAAQQEILRAGRTRWAARGGPARVVTVVCFA